jgi:hypothetical protein
MSEERLSLTLDARRTAIMVIDLQKGIVRMPGAPCPRPTVVANARANDFGSEEGSSTPRRAEGAVVNHPRFPKGPAAGAGGSAYSALRPRVRRRRG